MKHVSLSDAEARFAELIEEAERGGTVEIARDGHVVARLVPAELKPPIDIERLLRHQRSLTSPVQDTDTELEEEQIESRY